MSQRCPHAVPVEVAILENHKLIFSRVASIQPNMGSRVPGALWKITKDCEKKLDVYEGYPFLYRKKRIQVNGKTAMVYVMNTNEPAEPNKDYLTTILEGYNDWDLDTQSLLSAVQYTQISASK